MNRFSIAVDIPAAPDRVWEVLADVERWPEWTPSVTRISWPGVRVVADHAVEPTAAGSRATLSVRFEGLLASLVARLTRDLNQRYLGLEAAGLRERIVAPGWHRE